MIRKLVLALACVIAAGSLAGPTASAAVPDEPVLPKGVSLVEVPEDSPLPLPPGITSRWTGTCPS
jgi:hypothetical protein